MDQDHDTTGVTKPPVWEYLQSVPDPRHARGQRYPWLVLLALVVLAMVSGASSARAIAQWVGHHWDALVPALSLSLRRPPSESTIGRLFRGVDIARLEREVAAFAQALEAAEPSVEEGPLQGLAVDGKMLRAARVLLVSLVRHERATVLGQMRVPEHRGEVTAIRTLLAPHSLHGQVVTADAQLTERPLSRQILAQGGDYLLVVKANRPALYEPLRTLFGDPDFLAHEPPDTYTGWEKGHGRLDRRTLRTTSALAGYLDWPGAQQVIERDLEQYCPASGRRHREIVYAVTSLPPQRAGARELERLARGHWTIENRVHYVRDDTLREDRCLLRRGHSAEALAALRNGLLMAIREAGWRFVSDALRYSAAHLADAIQLLGIPPTLT